MISYIKGRVNSISEGCIILECAGIGYRIDMPASSLDRVTDKEEICVYTFMSVKEDSVRLFGFLTTAERAMFEMLLTVSGIGPKGALGILSSISADELKLAIAAGDSKLIASAKGVGNKTAQRIVVELKGKIEKEAAFAPSPPAGAGYAGYEAKTRVSQAADVLEALGFSRTAALKAVNSVENADELDSSALVSEALKIIG